MEHYLKVRDSEEKEFFIKASDYPLLVTDRKITVYEQWPGCRKGINPYWVSYTCTRRSHAKGVIKTKTYIGKFLEIVKNG